MNTDEIDHILRRHDTLPEKPRLLVCNTDASDKPGQHWICMHFENGRGEYFDSFGRRSTANFERYMNRHCSSWTFNHSLNGSSDSVNGDLQFLISYGNRHISTRYKISTPEPIEKKFGTVDYVHEGTHYTKFGTNPPTEGFWANG